LRKHPHPISNELLGRPSDAGIAFAEAKQYAGADGAAGSDSSAILSAPRASTGPAKRASPAERTIAKQALEPIL
jgi:hypothetical protein